MRDFIKVMARSGELQPGGSVSRRRHYLLLWNFPILIPRRLHDWLAGL